MGIFSLDNFDKYDLTSEQIKFAFILFTSIWLTISVISVSLLKDNQRRLAWIISLVNSFTMMIIGLLYLTFKIKNHRDFFMMKEFNRDIFHQLDNFNVLVSIWFGLANIFDLLVGTLFYRKYVDPLSGYIHHTIAVWMCYAGSTGDGVFVQVEVFASFFIIMMLIEIPTFLLAFGAVFPQFRTDLGFGITFLLFRLIYHIYMFVYAIKSQVSTCVIVLGTMFLILHIFWYYNWVTKYGSKLFKKGKEQKEVKQA